MTAACHCGRQGRGFYFQLPNDRDAPRHPACSMNCLNTIKLRRGMMTENQSHLTCDEYQSIMAASPEIGAWLEKLGKTDMAQMSYEEWLDMLAFAYSRICHHNALQWAEDAPF